MIQIGLVIKDEPDFYPDHLDVEALPPVTTLVTISGTDYLIVGLRLVVRETPLKGVFSSYYVATLKRVN